MNTSEQAEDKEEQAMNQAEQAEGKKSDIHIDLFHTNLLYISPNTSDKIATIYSAKAS